ncbi:hypothetical protein [Spirosoma aerophilum]
MNRDALKFTDLDAFLEVVEGMGFNGEVTDLIYEQGKLPYCTAYFVPTHLLPSTFDLESIDQFGGTIAQVEQVRYLGTEEFNADFMIFPLSMVGYVEVDSLSPVNFVPNTPQVDWTTGEMIFVINLEDGGGKEFYLNTTGSLVGLADQSDDEPHLFKTHKQVIKQLDLLRQKYPQTCKVYPVDYRDFEARRKSLLLNPDQ